MLGGVAALGETAPPGLPEEVASDWAALGADDGARQVFSADLVSGLPEPVGRWLRHAVAEGTPVARATQVRMSGAIKLGRWAPFRGQERLTVGGGFVWAATARPLGLPVRGFDRWTRGSGQMRWRLFGAVPILSATGEDVTRSAAGRHAGEMLILMPTAALAPEVSWRSSDADSAVATVHVGERTHEVTITVDPDGQLVESVIQRWGPLGHGAFGLQPFGVTLRGEVAAGGMRIPRRVTAGWYHGTDRWAEGQFIRWTVDGARFG
jgi:hypothetical protein